MICEAQIYDKKTKGLDWRDRFRQCRKEAVGTVFGVPLCTPHVGTVAMFRVIDLCGNRELTLGPHPNFVAAVEE